MAVDLEVFRDLPDTATVRIVSVAGSVKEKQLAPLLAVLEALIEQWKENEVIRDGAVSAVANNGFIVFAYVPSGGGISGCTNDQLTHTFLDFEKQLGIPLLNAPRMAVQSNGGVEFMRLPEFRRRREAGEIGPETVVYDHLVTNLGDARKGFETTVAESWYAPVGA